MRNKEVTLLIITKQKFKYLIEYESQTTKYGIFQSFSRDSIKFFLRSMFLLFLWTLSLQPSSPCPCLYWKSINTDLGLFLSTSEENIVIQFLLAHRTIILNKNLFKNMLISYLRFHKKIILPIMVIKNNLI